jgi:hypothetical protein
MAKCPMCNSKKGKRVCKLVENQKVCSLCCGTTRNTDCVGCEYYKTPLASRKYNTVPKYSTQDMESNFTLQEYSNEIESALCKIDREYDLRLKDEIALDIYKLLMDKYFFRDKEFVFKSDIVKNGFELICSVIEYNNFDSDNEMLVKTIGVLYFVANRRTKGGREYFKVIEHYVGGGNGVYRIPNYPI